MYEAAAIPPSLLIQMMMGVTAGIGAIGLAGLAAPAFRQRVFPVVEPHKLRDHVLLDRVLEDGTTVACTDGTLFRVMQVDGVDLGSRSDEVKEELQRRRVQWIDGLADAGGGSEPIRQLTFRTLYDHRSGVESYINPMLREVQAVWHEGFSRAYRNRHFLVLSVPPGSASGREKLVQLSEHCRTKLQDFKASVLEMGTPGAASPLLGFLAELLNPGREVEVAAHPGTPSAVEASGRMWAGAQDKRLADRLCGCEAMFHDGWGARGEDGIAVFRNGPDEVWMGVLGVSVWGDESSPDILNHVMSVEAEMVVAQWLEVMDQTKARLILEDMARKHHNEMLGKKWGINRSKMDQAEAAISVVSSHSGQMWCNHQLEIFVFGRTRKDLEARMDLVIRAMEHYRIRVIRERAASEVVWFSMLPPHWRKPGLQGYGWHRQVKLFSGNVAHFMNFNTPARGLDTCDWGPRPVNVFKTREGTPFSFCWHISADQLATGHTLMIGNTGGGKTVLVNWLAVSSLGYDKARAFLFDRSDGSYVATKAFGGAYMHLQTDVAEVGDACQLNPLHQDLSIHGTWVVQWLRDFVTGCTDIESERTLVGIIQNMARIPAGKRTLKDIYQAIPSNVAIHKELERWIDGGQYAWLFGSAHDTLEFGAERLVTFDFTRILSDPIATKALLPYLSYRIKTAMESVGAPWLMAIDEAAALIADPTFRKWYFELLQEARKMRGVVVSCFQRISTLRDAGVTDLVLGQCPTRLILPNESASADDYIGLLGLTDEEFKIVNKTHPICRRLGRYVLLWREGEGSVVLDVDLQALGRHLDLFRSGRGPADRLRALERSEGNVERAVRRYLQQGG